MLTEHTDWLVGGAERQAEAIGREAEPDADIQRTDAVAAKRLLGRIDALELPLAELVVSIRDEMKRISRELERAKDTNITRLPSGRGDAHGDPATSEGGHLVDDDMSGGGPEPGARTTPEDPAPDEPEARLEPDVDAPIGPSEALKEDSPSHSAHDPITAAPDSESGPVGREARASAEPDEGRGRLLGRLKSKPRPQKGGAVIATDAHCAACRADGWQLHERARLPVRRGGS